MMSQDETGSENKSEDRHGKTSQIVQVAVPLPIRSATPLCYDYSLPEGISAKRGTIVEVPLGKRHVWGVVLSAKASGQISTTKLKQVVSVASLPCLSESHLRFLQQLSDWTMAPFGMVMRMMLSTPKAHLPPKARIVYGKSEEGQAEALSDVKLTPKRQRVMRFVADGHVMSATDLAKETGTSVQIVKSMAQQGLLARHEIIKDEPIGYQHMTGTKADVIRLTDDQQDIADKLCAHSEDGYSAHLLDGVTGSGKTEVYFSVVAQMMARGKQVLILLPEIALTAAWQARFEARFGMRPLIWHSSVSSARRRDLWRACLRGEPVVVVGARSAICLPFANLGLIIVDEEHEQAFKQEDMVIYHARDMAVMRAHIESVPVILATATPSLESWVNAGHSAGALPTRYQHWRLEARIGEAKLPEITMIDLKKDRPSAGRWLSGQLIKEIEARLKAGEQSLLFLNRRGYAPLSICEQCGTKATCQSCDSWLVTHRLSGTKQCHHCGFRQPLRNQCDNCQTEGQMRAYGPGVERLAEEAGLLFPDARMCIFSSDTAARPEVAQEMIRSITDGEVDIIIGTQMAAKGHHFPNLTLVGVIDADFGLQGGDLRAAERTYQMLSQASGRAGRASATGKAFLQSYEPDNAVFSALASGNRDAFLALETQMRQSASMPPFGKLAAVIVSGPDEGAVMAFAVAIAENRPAYQSVQIYGPTPAPIARLRGRYRVRFLISAPKDVHVQKIVHEWLDEVRVPSQIFLQIDIDPYSFL